MDPFGHRPRIGIERLRYLRPGGLGRPASPFQRTTRPVAPGSYNPRAQRFPVFRAQPMIPSRPQLSFSQKKADQEKNNKPSISPEVKDSPAETKKENNTQNSSTEGPNSEVPNKKVEELVKPEPPKVPPTGNNNDQAGTPDKQGTPKREKERPSNENEKKITSDDHLTEGTGGGGKEEVGEEEEEESDEEDTGFCQHCNISFSNPDAYWKHTRGLLHTQRVMESQRKEAGGMCEDSQMMTGDNSSVNKLDDQTANFDIQYPNNRNSSTMQYQNKITDQDREYLSKQESFRNFRPNQQQLSNSHKSHNNNQYNTKQSGPGFSKGEGSQQGQGGNQYSADQSGQGQGYNKKQYNTNHSGQGQGYNKNQYENQGEYDQEQENYGQTAEYSEDQGYQEGYYEGQGQEEYYDEGQGDGEDYSFNSSNWMELDKKPEKIPLEQRDLDPDSLGKAQFPNKYHCKICNVSCTGDKNYRMHVEGNRHKVKAMAAADGGPVELPQELQKRTLECSRPSKVDKIISKSDAPIIGLQYITEFQKGDPSARPTYVCNLCESKCDMNTVLPHVTGFKHRSNYFKEKHPDIHAHLISNTAKKKSEQNTSAEEFALDVMKKDGQGKIRVKIMIDEVTEKAAANLLQQGGIEIDKFLDDLASKPLKQALDENKPKRLPFTLARGVGSLRDEEEPRSTSCSFSSVRGDRDSYHPPKRPYEDYGGQQQQPKSRRIGDYSVPSYSDSYRSSDNYSVYSTTQANVIDYNHQPPSQDKDTYGGTNSHEATDPYVGTNAYEGSDSYANNYGDYIEENHNQYTGSDGSYVHNMQNVDDEDKQLFEEFLKWKKEHTAEPKQDAPQETSTDASTQNSEETTKAKKPDETSTQPSSQVSEMLYSLSQTMINTEEEAAMALQVSNALTQALLQYRLKNVPQELRAGLIPSEISTEKKTESKSKQLTTGPTKPPEVSTSADVKANKQPKTQVQPQSKSATNPTTSSQGISTSSVPTVASQVHSLSSQHQQSVHASSTVTASQSSQYLSQPTPSSANVSQSYNQSLTSAYVSQQAPATTDVGITYSQTLTSAYLSQPAAAEVASQSYSQPSQYLTQPPVATAETYGQTVPSQYHSPQVANPVSFPQGVPGVQVVGITPSMAYTQDTTSAPVTNQVVQPIPGQVIQNYPESVIPSAGQVPQYTGGYSYYQNTQYQQQMAGYQWNIPGALPTGVPSVVPTGVPPPAAPPLPPAEDIPQPPPENQTY